MIMMTVMPAMGNETQKRNRSKRKNLKAGHDLADGRHYASDNPFADVRHFLLSVTVTNEPKSFFHQ